MPVVIALRSSVRRAAVAALARACGVALLAVLVGANVAAADATVRGQPHTVDVDGRQRRYVLYAPGHADNLALPLVMVLHGQGGSAAQVLEQGHWIDVADRHGFAVIAPEGVLEHPDRRPTFFGNRRSWNAGPTNASPAERQHVDDVHFLRRALKQAQQQLRVDPRRVYVTGFSNGAAMAFRAAAELPEHFAAVAPVSSALLVPAPHSTRLPSLLLIWGSSDPVNPYAGGEVRRAGESVHRPAARQSFDRWAQALGCAGEASVAAMGEGVSRLQAAACPSGRAAELITVAGLAHQWPGGKIYARLIAGEGSNRIDASELIWRFFAAHPRP